ncbi:hypothetical protein BC826DRAFT_980308 [Russula brevipes]|nr:hypothetical protein BC826DRAFT_980308 [Russula brevipes]
MAVCQYFLRGTCRFGDQCRNEHPQTGQADRRSVFGGSTWTPANVQKTIPYSLETMAKDFDVKADRPSWPLSSYGPAKHEQNLLPPLDESPDELRFKAVTAIRNGTINEYLQYEQNAFASAEQLFANVRNDMKGAFDAAKRHSFGTGPPNHVPAPPVRGRVRRSVLQPRLLLDSPPSLVHRVLGPPFVRFWSVFRPKPPFGGAAATGGGFSAFAGPGPSAFATTAATPTTSPASVFGQSAFSGTGGGAQPGQPAFGTANSTSTSSAFGRPSAFGPTSGSAFVQTSPFGAANNAAASAFGQPAPTSTFGQATTASSTSPTAPPFGQPAPNTSPFGQPTSAFGQPTPAASAFGQPATNSAFGQSTSPFGAQTPQSAFGQTVSTVSPSGPTNASRSTAPDFANAKSTYKPGLDPYDALLPANYSSLLPDTVRAAFAAPRFSWDNVPDWIPPLDMR